MKRVYWLRDIIFLYEPTYFIVFIYVGNFKRGCKIHHRIFRAVRVVRGDYRRVVLGMEKSHDIVEHDTVVCAGSREPGSFYGTYSFIHVFTPTVYHKSFRAFSF